FVFTGLIHVPMVIRLPGPSRQGREIDQPVGLIDIVPTVLKIVGLDAPKEMKGHDLLDPQPKPILSNATFSSGHISLIQYDRKLLYDQGRLALYDLQHDFYERTNLLEHGNPEDVLKAKQMKGTIEAMVKQDDLHLGAPVEWT